MAKKTTKSTDTVLKYFLLCYVTPLHNWMGGHVEETAQQKRILKRWSSLAWPQIYIVWSFRVACTYKHESTYRSTMRSSAQAGPQWLICQTNPPCALICCPFLHLCFLFLKQSAVMFRCRAAEFQDPRKKTLSISGAKKRFSEMHNKNN